MATEYLTKPDIDMILESLRYTKEAFQKYQGSTRRVSSSKNVSEHRTTKRLYTSPSSGSGYEKPFRSCWVRALQFGEDAPCGGRIGCVR